MNKKFEIGERVTISTHGSNIGTVLKFPKNTHYIFGNSKDSVIIQMDCEFGPRLCLKDNVYKINGNKV